MWLVPHWSSWPIPAAGCSPRSPQCTRTLSAHSGVPGGTSLSVKWSSVHCWEPRCYSGDALGEDRTRDLSGSRLWDSEITMYITENSELFNPVNHGGSTCKLQIIFTKYLLLIMSPIEVPPSNIFHAFTLKISLKLWWLKKADKLLEIAIA